MDNSVDVILIVDDASDDLFPADWVLGLILADL